MTVTALIVAAGRGTRAGGPKPKQWQEVLGRPCAEWTLRAFANHPGVTRLMIVLHPDDIEHPLPKDIEVMRAIGGETRDASVRNGLEALRDTDTTQVLIHDVARPAVPHRVISQVLKALIEVKAAAPGLAVTDALWTGSEGTVTGTQDRNGLFRAQTPQGFDYQTILTAHQQNSGQAADDVEVARKAGIPVRIVPGHEDNLKITTPYDFDRAARILAAQKGAL